MQLHAIAVPRQRDIGRMPVEPRRRQHVNSVDRHPLRFVDRGGVTVIDRRVILQVERHGATVVEHHCHACGRDAFNPPERSVLHAEAAFISAEHHSVTNGKRALDLFNSKRDIAAKRSSALEAVACGQVERLHLVIGVGEDDPARAGLRGAPAIPAVDQIGTCIFARGHDMHRIMVTIRGNGFTGALGGEMPRRGPLSVFALATDVGDLDAAMMLSDRAERRPRLDRLKLLGIADQHDLGAALLGFRDHALHLPRSDHSRFIDHQYVAGG